MIRRAIRPGLLALLGAVAGCGSRSPDATAIVLEVVAGTVDAASLDEVVFRVSGPGLAAGMREARAPLKGPEARSFPLTLVLLEDRNGDGAAASGPFTVVVEGLAAGVTRARPARDDGPIAFETGKVVRRRYELRPVNDPETPDGGSPGPGRGTPPPSTPPPDGMSPPRDAGAPPPPPDAAPAPRPPDAAPPPDSTGASCTHDQTCSDDRCVCDPGCSCTLACAGAGGCKPTCRGGSSCTIEVASAGQVKVACAEGATCRVQSRGAAPSELTVECKSASCELACGAARECNLDCKDGSRCLVRCEMTGKCELKNCGSAVLECGGGVRVCGRPCP